jgi:O-antigen ligase
LICWLGVTAQIIDDGASFSQIFNFRYSYMNLEKYVTLSGIHFSLYIIVAIIFCLDSIKSGERVIVSILRFILITLFTIFTLHLGSRMGILIILAVVITFFINRFITSRAIVNLFAPLILMLIIAVGVFNMPYLKVRILEYAVSMNSDNISIKDKRLVRWKAGWEIFEDNIVFGVGSGDVEEKLLESYEKNQLVEAHKNKLNAHNQFLQMSISNGLIGVSLFIAILIFQFHTSIKYKSFVWFAFTLSICLASFTESILNRQKSVLLFSLFTCLFIKYYERERRSGSFGLWLRGS